MFKCKICKLYPCKLECSRCKNLKWLISRYYWEDTILLREDIKNKITSPKVGHGLILNSGSQFLTLPSKRYRNWSSILEVKRVKLLFPFTFQNKQAENGLQSRSSENGRTEVWHYGLKLQMTREFIHWLSWTIMNYHRGGGVTTGMDEWHGWLAWMTGMDDWHGWWAWMMGMDDWHGWLAWMTGMDD